VCPKNESTIIRYGIVYEQPVQRFEKASLFRPRKKRVIITVGFGASLKKTTGVLVGRREWGKGIAADLQRRGEEGESCDREGGEAQNVASGVAK